VGLWLVPLDEALSLPRPVREHRDHVARPGQLYGPVDRLQISLASPDRETAAGVDHVAKRPPVQLRLGHEAKEALGPEWDAQRPWIEVRNVVCCEDESAFRGQIFLALGT
jgi:hypothetical protein